MNRSFTAALVLGAASLVLQGHSPYVQWYAYRAKHLVVVTDQERPGAFAQATAVAAAVAARWSQSKAVAALARTPREVVSLLRSGQLQVALLAPEDARDALQARGKFAGSVRVPLRALAFLGADVVVVLEGYPAEKAAMIARALGALRSAQTPAPPPVPYHPAALDPQRG